MLLRESLNFCSCTTWFLDFVQLRGFSYNQCQGLTNQLNFKGKTNRLKVPLQNAYFYYFGQFHVFPLYLLGNYPVHKIDQSPLLRILSLCMDQQGSTVCNHWTIYIFISLCLHQASMHCLSMPCCIALTIVHSYAEALSVPMLDWHNPIYGSPFNLSPFNL